MEEPRPGGRLKRQLEAGVRAYVADRKSYAERRKSWEEDFGRVGEPPAPPKAPEWLELWFELQRWPGRLLVSGGLLEQPAWSWEMIDLAGLVYRLAVKEG